MRPCCTYDTFFLDRLTRSGTGNLCVMAYARIKINYQKDQKMRGINGLSLRWSEVWGKRGSLRSTPLLRGAFLPSQGLWIVAVFADRLAAPLGGRRGKV